MILYINGCVREESRTEKLAKALLNKLGQYKELNLEKMGLSSLDRKTLNKRTELIAQGNYQDSMFDYAKEFVSAEVIVIAAPFWDGGFPAIVKTYLENIYVTGIVSKYSEKGEPIGLCKAKMLYYVTTAGGPYFPNYSYDYIHDLAVQMFGIKQTQLIYAENLDIFGNNPDEIIEKTMIKYELVK